VRRPPARGNLCFSYLNEIRPQICLDPCKTENMDWRRAASQMLRAIRGRRSQKGLSRRLGYRSNVACDWEAGRRLPTAIEALRACHRVGIDVPRAFAAFQPACAHALGARPSFHVDAWLRELAGSLGARELSSRCGKPRLTIARWMSGKTRPRLHDFLALVEAISGRASDLVGALVPIASVAELHAVHLQRAAAKRLAFDDPWSAAVLRVLETRGYREHGAHTPGYVAERLTLTFEQEQASLQRLLAAGLLRFDAGRYEAGEPLTVDTQASADDVRKLRSHWTRVGLERVQAPRPADWLGFNLVSTSDSDLERIRDVLRRAYREIRAIAAGSEPAESVALLNLQLVTWNDPPG
jgi:transcriptional regulator with XRE-family HTH domain